MRHSIFVTCNKCSKRLGAAKNSGWVSSCLLSSFFPLSPHLLSHLSYLNIYRANPCRRTLQLRVIHLLSHNLNLVPILLILKNVKKSIFGKNMCNTGFTRCQKGVGQGSVRTTLFTVLYHATLNLLRDKSLIVWALPSLSTEVTQQRSIGSITYQANEPVHLAVRWINKTQAFAWKFVNEHYQTPGRPPQVLAENWYQKSRKAWQGSFNLR